MAYQGILDACNECGVCVDECLFLQKYGLTPLEAVLDEEAREHGPPGSASKHAADAGFACLLCGLCDSVCPSQLSPTKMFGTLRARVAQNKGVTSTCRPFLSDKKYNIYTIYRSANSIDYGDLYRQKTKTILFPGCSLGTFFPKLTRALYEKLAKTQQDLGMLMDCCHKPLEDLGLEERYEKASGKLNATLDEMGVEKIITACPSCLAVLRERFRERQVVSCYYELGPFKDQAVLPSFGKATATEKENGPEGNERVKITVHDSCSDREYGVVGPQVRHLFSQAKDVDMFEMVHSGKNSMCCGSGGLVPAFDPELASEVKRRRMAEAESSGAEIMVTYCATCANAFRSGGNPSKVEVRHALELLLGVKEDYDAVQKNLVKLFGPGKRKELYDRLMQSSP